MDEDLGFKELGFVEAPQPAQKDEDLGFQELGFKPEAAPAPDAQVTQDFSSGRMKFDPATKQFTLAPAQEAAPTPAPLSLAERMASVTPEKLIKAGAVGVEEAIPFPTTGVAAGLKGAYESLQEGRPLTNEDIRRNYIEMQAQKGVQGGGHFLRPGRQPAHVVNLL